jgi:hypothetical protein
MYPNDFSVPHAVLVQAQMGFTILTKGFDRSALQIQGDDPLGTPIHAIGHQYGIGPRQLCAFTAQHPPDFAEPGNAFGQRKGPVGGLPHRHRPVRGGQDEQDEVCHPNVWP